MNFDLNYIFDFFVLLIILISSLLSFWRGILKELFIIFIWIISILLTSIISPDINSFISDYINFNPLSILLSILIPFITMLLIFSVINSFIIFPLLYPLNGLTNSLIGLAFGFVRGALIICILYYFSSLSESFSELINKNFKSSFSLEYIDFITEYILYNIPKNFNYTFLK
tara:strand:+ start:288 stop:800 length:513 start_codon:yes stop_codon:yes gene_type:complete